VAIEADATDKAVATDEVHKAEEAITAIELPLDGNEAVADNKIHLVDKADEVNKTNKARFNVTIEADAADEVNKIVMAYEVMRLSQPTRPI